MTKAGTNCDPEGEVACWAATRAMALTWQGLPFDREWGKPTKRFTPPPGNVREQMEATYVAGHCRTGYPMMGGDMIGTNKAKTNEAMFGDYKKLLDSNKAIILGVGRNDEECTLVHFVTLIGYTDTHFIIADPYCTATAATHWVISNKESLNDAGDCVRAADYMVCVDEEGDDCEKGRKYITNVVEDTDEWHCITNVHYVQGPLPK